MQIIAANKKANHDYFINEKFEAGLVLTGSEVKSLRINTGSIKESFISEKEGELWLTNCYIKKYSASNNQDTSTTRDRKVLVHKKQLNKIIGASRRDGMTIVPIILYFNEKGLAKLTIGLAKGKKKQDKRASIKDKEWNIKKQRMVKNQSF
jgi:SsrA-binding protein